MNLDDVYEELLDIVSTVGARVDVPIESERFFSNLVESYDGTKEQFLDYVKSNLDEWFKSFAGMPEWIQDPEWQFDEGKPMIFVGQINIPATATDYFHDDASFYVFWNPNRDEVKVVIQVA